MDESKESKLPKPEQRFLSYMLNLARHADVSFLTKEAIVEKITCAGIMNGKGTFPGFKGQKDRRADLIVACVGTKRNSALAMEPEDAGRALQRSLDVDDTNLAEIFDTVGDDDFVKTQNPEELWGLLTAANWWKQSTAQSKLMMAKALKVVVIENLLGETGSSNHRKNTFYEMVKIIGVKLFASRRIPVEINEMVFEQMLELGEANKPQPMNAQKLLAILKPEVLVEHLELADLYRVIEEVALRYKFQAKEEPKAPEVKLLEAGTPDVDDEVEDAVEMLIDESSDRPTGHPPAMPSGASEAPAVELTGNGSESDLPSLETLQAMSRGSQPGEPVREDSGLNRMPGPPSLKPGSTGPHAAQSRGVLFGSTEPDGKKA